MKRMRRCAVCRSYTLEETHCGTQTQSPHPPKYSPQDKYAKYRRIQRTSSTVSATLQLRMQK